MTTAIKITNALAIRYAAAQALAWDLLDTSVELDGEPDHDDDDVVRLLIEAGITEAASPLWMGRDEAIDRWRQVYRTEFKTARGLRVELQADGWCVYDERDDSRWWPKAEAFSMFTGDSPTVEMLATCIADPDRGEWRS